MQLDEAGRVEDRHRRLIGDGLAHVVGVDDIAEHVGRVAVARLDRRPVKPTKVAFGQGLAQVTGEAKLLPHIAIADHEACLEAVLRSVRLVGDDDDVAALGQQRMLRRPRRGTSGSR